MDILLIALLTILASGIGTLTGFGTSTIMVPILLFFLPLPETLLLVGIIHWFGDIWKMLLFKKGFEWKLILSFGIPGILASFLGATIVFSASDALLSRLLGVFLIVYVLFLFLKPAFTIPKKVWTAGAGGALSGLFAGIFGVGGAVRSAFLSAFNLPKTTYIATVGAIAFAIDITRIGTYIANGTWLSERFVWALTLFIPVSLAGAWVAKKIVNRIPQKQFRIVIAVFLLVAGITYIISPR